jgi:hypothetical protein
VAGNGSFGFAGDGGPATGASLSTPTGVATDAAGNLFIADNYNYRIRKVAVGTGVITTVAGNGSFGYAGDGGPATSASLASPSGVAVDAAGNLFIADLGNNRIRMVTAGTGIITTVAGNGNPGFAGDGAAATGASLNYPSGVAVDAAGNLYIADQGNNRIRMVTAGTGVITTVAGNGVQGFGGDGGPATSASLYGPIGTATDPAGNMFIADQLNERIRKVTALDSDADGIPDVVEVAEGRNPLVKDNDIFSPGAASARLFAMQQYRDFLGREGDSAGIQGWANAVASGSWTRLQVIDAFLNSQEFAGFVAPVVRLYFATFLRVPDYAGLVFNAGLVRAGTITPTQLADFFTVSPEFQATYGSLNDTQFVTLLYNNVLGRAPDPAGLAGWVSLLQSGYTRGQVLIGFSDSVEYQAQMANEVFVTMMYAGMLHRTPEPLGFSGWVAFLDAGTYTREQVINGFFLSTEYHNRFLP